MANYMKICVLLLLFIVFCGDLALALDTQEVFVQFSNEEYIFTHDKPEKWTAHGTLKNEMNKTGWSYLEIITNKQYPNYVQAYSAGLLEGLLTKELIDQTWYNNQIDAICPKPLSKACKRLRHFLKQNLEWMKKQVRLHRDNTTGENTDYWHQVELFLTQVSGLTDGYNNKPQQPSLDIDIHGLWLLQMSGDIATICTALNVPIAADHPLMGYQEMLGSGSCSALIKVVEGDVYVSQNTWNHYSSMVRVLKKYHFHYVNSKHEPLPGNTISFSSYPGFLFSMDDFYILSSHMVSQETTIGNLNDDLWKFVQPESVPESVRVMISNRLATSGKQWVETFSQHNSGTYNNEWMIVDYKLLHRDYQTHKITMQPGFFTLLDQVPGHIKHADMTWYLRENTYYGSYNIPYFPEIYNISGWPATAKKHGDFFTYSHGPRANIFRRNHTFVTDMGSMVKLMRYNDYKHDVFALCKGCSPPYSAENGIAARSDLNPVNGTYPLPLYGHRMHGSIDIKVTSYDLAKNFEFVARAGPTNDQQPTFEWSTSGFSGTRHRGQPDKFDFPLVHVKWLLP